VLQQGPEARLGSVVHWCILRYVDAGSTKFAKRGTNKYKPIISIFDVPFSMSLRKKCQHSFEYRIPAVGLSDTLKVKEKIVDSERRSEKALERRFRR